MNTLFTTFLLTALATVVSSEELKASDVPQACMAICGPIVTLTNTCDINPDGSRRLARRQDNDGDSKDDETDEPIEAQCICNNRSFNVRSVAALCAACLTQNRGKTEDMNKIMSQCSFASTTYVPAATSVVAGISVVATKPTVTGSSGTGSTRPSGSGSGTAAASATGAGSGTGTSAGVSLRDESRYGAALQVAGILGLALAWFL